MVKAIRVHNTGSADVMKWEDIDHPNPEKGEVLIRHTAIGLNYIDVYFRSGVYPVPAGLPFVPGNEGAGIVEEIGVGVEHLKLGDRVAYAGPIGSYSEKRVIPANNLVKLPDEISEKVVAGMMLQGMTVQYLLRQTYNVTSDTVLLFHAAAGGVGLIAGQWAKQLGATTIGTVSSKEKAELALANGYSHVINYKTENFVERVKEITNGRGCDVVYDSVGRDTYPASLDCIKPQGLWVSFGQSSGVISEFNLGLLSQKGSLFATRPTLFSYIATRDALEKTAGDLFKMVLSGAVNIHINQEYPLANAVQAHKELETRMTTGTSVLLP